MNFKYLNSNNETFNNRFLKEAIEVSFESVRLFDKNSTYNHSWINYTLIDTKYMITEIYYFSSIEDDRIGNKIFKCSLNEKHKVAEIIEYRNFTLYDINYVTSDNSITEKFSHDVTLDATLNFGSFNILLKANFENPHTLVEMINQLFE